MMSAATASGPISYRSDISAADRDAVRMIVASTNMFRPAEIDIAVELVDERLNKGDASGYHFIFADIDGKPAGYAAYGPIACTVSSYDLFWIAVDKRLHGQGIGKALLLQAEAAVCLRGGVNIYAETSSRPDYESTRAFYERNGYALEAVVRDFYDQDDSKFIYVKSVKGEE